MMTSPFNLLLPSTLCLSKVASDGMGAACALRQQLCVPLEGSSWAALTEHLRQFLHFHTCVSAEGSVVFGVCVFSRINKHFSY